MMGDVRSTISSGDEHVPGNADVLFRGGDNNAMQAVAVAMRVHLASALLGMTLYTTTESGHAAREALATGLDGLLAGRTNLLTWRMCNAG